MNSAYAALLKQIEDEALGAATSAPPLDTSAVITEPTPPATTVAAPAVETAPVEPSPTTTTPVEPLRARTTPETLRTLAEKYGVHMADAAPLPPSPNNASLAADLGRAGATIGAAIGGVKPDTDFYDNIEKRGAAHAQQNDKNAAGYVDFKRQLLAKVATEKAAKGDKDPELSDPQSPRYLAAEAMVMSQPRMAALWKNTKTRAKEMNVVPDIGLFLKQYKVSNAESNQQSEDNSVRNEEAGYKKQNKALTHAETMEELRQGNREKNMVLADALKELGEIRHATVPDWSVKPDAHPTVVDGERVKLNNYKTLKVTQGLDRLMDYMKAHPDAFDKLNPLDDEKSELSVLYGKVRDAYRVAEDFGVPSGKDMQMIGDVVQDPRRFVNIFSGRDMAGFETLKRATEEERNAYNNAHGYVQPKAGATPAAAPRPQSPLDKVKARIMGGGESPEAETQPKPNGGVKIETGTTMTAKNGKTYRWDGDSWEEAK